MRSFIRFSGKEISVENVRIVDMEFNDTFIKELRNIYGQKAQFNITPFKNFIAPEQTDNIFNGVITGQYEGEAPISISVFYDIQPLEAFESESELPEPDLVVPAFLGFRK